MGCMSQKTDTAAVATENAQPSDDTAARANDAAEATAVLTPLAGGVNLLGDATEQGASCCGGACCS